MTVVTATLNPCIDKTFSVDRVVPDRKLNGTNVRQYPGGGGINVARVLSRLGAPTRALWSSGGDNGQRLGRLLDAEGLRHEPVPVEDEVRENLIIRDDSTGQQYRFGMPGPLLGAADREQWMRRIRELDPKARYVVFSGSLPGGTSPDWYAELLRAVPGGIRLIVDTKKEALRRALELGVYLVKPNVNELGDLVGREMTDDAAIEQAAREIVERGGAEVVVVSLGRAGALLVTRDTATHFLSPSVRPRSKVGAGDSMVGGLVAALAEDRPLADAVKLGVAAGAAAVMSEGTGLAHADDTERLYQRVRS